MAADTVWSKVGSTMNAAIPAGEPKGVTLQLQNQAVSGKGAVLSNLYDPRIGQ